MNFWDTTPEKPEFVFEDEKRKLIENPSLYEEVHRKDNSLPLIIFDELHKYSN